MSPPLVGHGARRSSEVGNPRQESQDSGRLNFQEAYSGGSVTASLLASCVLRWCRHRWNTMCPGQSRSVEDSNVPVPSCEIPWALYGVILLCHVSYIRLDPSPIRVLSALHQVTGSAGSAAAAEDEEDEVPRWAAASSASRTS